MGKFHQFLSELSVQDIRIFISESVFSFSDGNLSKLQWILTKLGMCIHIMEIWFEIANGQILSIFLQLSAHMTVAGYYCFTLFGKKKKMGYSLAFPGKINEHIWCKKVSWVLIPDYFQFIGVTRVKGTIKRCHVLCRSSTKTRGSQRYHTGRNPRRTGHSRSSCTVTSK